MTADHSALPCAVCDGVSWIDLPAIGPSSMASDWRVVPAPLRRRACQVCGVVRSFERMSAGDLFTRGYALYNRGPDDERDRARQAQYAAWIGTALGSRPPRRVLDVGCGNGGLLHALGHRWPSATLMGCDLSIESIEHGRHAGLMLWPGAATDLPLDLRADLVLTVNVIEHTVDPLSFLHSLRDRLSPDGLLVLVCPDGSGADVELLMADHVHSFARQHLERMLARAGLGVRGWAEAPETLGAFQMVMAAPDVRPAPTASLDRHDDIVHGKAEYLERWARLDVNLRARLGAGPVTCFGIGETAGLLRAYAPRAWSQVLACTADRLAEASFDGVSVMALTDVPADQALLVGVRPRDQERVAARLRPRFTRVVTWYDFVAPDVT